MTDYPLRRIEASLKKHQEAKRKLKPFNAIIQVCPVCGQVDVYKDDNHDCGQHFQNQQSLYYKD